MSKDAIIEWVYANKKIKRYIASICPSDKEELLSELVIQLYKMDLTKLVLAYNTKYLEYLCFTIAKRISYGTVSGTGIFYKKTKTSEISEKEMEVKEDFDDYDEEKLNRLKEILEKKHWYSKTLFKLYYIEGYNLREISEKYGINLKSIYYTIDKLKKEIKKEI